MKNRSFEKEVMKIAIPVALQSMLQSSFSMVDQIMVGQLGEKSIAGIEIAGKPSFIYSFVLGAIAAIAGIMVSQYIGKEDRKQEEKSICINLLISVVVGLIFFAVASGFSSAFMQVFTGDKSVIAEGERYLRLIGWTFIPMGITTILAVPIRCHGKSSWPLYVGLLSAVVNTGLNYVLIFGHFGFMALGIKGAAIASVVSQVLSVIITVAMFFRLYGKIKFSVSLGKSGYIQYFKMLIPVVLNEFLWSIGQSINTFVYGHMGTAELAAMSLTGPVQGLMIGALSGIAQAAGILIGKKLGEGDYNKAYKESIWLCIYGFAGSLCLSVLLVFLRFPYVHIYQVEATVHSIGAMLLLAFAILTPVKVLNMILGGGVIRSGGKTKYIMMIDMLGTWLIGVPLALYTGLVLKFPIVWVYFILSQEELVRLIISVFMFKSRKWMNTID